MAPAADGGLEASKRMHEYLLSKQRKQEEFWLRKYGKVLQQPPPSVGKPAGNPRLPSLGGGSSSGGGGGGGSGPGSSRGSNNGSGVSGGLLPPLPGALQPPGQPAGLLPHHHRQPKGHAPIFHAQEPVKDFFTRNARQPRASGGIPVARDDFGNALPPSHRPPEPYRRPMPAQLPPMAGGYAQSQLQQRLVSNEYREPGGGGGDQLRQQPSQEYGAESPQQQQQQYGSGGGAAAADYQSPHHQHASPRGPGQLLRGSPRAGGRGLPPVAQEGTSGRSLHGGASSSTAAAKGPLRNLEMELSVIRAIKAREDVLERLRVASGKLDSGFGGSAPVVLSPVDPLVRLFYRLVGTLRQRTLDVIEAIAAWRRKINPSEPFIYYGVDYMAAIGPDVGFLDELPFLRTRLTFGRAADDPFLAEVTPDGIPIEEATTCDLRRGGQRFSSDALRIRMARKVLAHYCGRAMPGASGSAFTLDGNSSAASGGGLASEPSGPRSTRSVPSLGGQSSRARLEEEEEEEGGMTTAQILRALSPPVVPVTSLMPPAVRAITPPAGTDSAAAVAQSPRQEQEAEQERMAVAATVEEAEEEEEEEEEEEQAPVQAEVSEAQQAKEEEEEEEEEEEGQAEVEAGTVAVDADQPTAINLAAFQTLAPPPPPPPIPEEDEEEQEEQEEEQQEEQAMEAEAQPELEPEPESSRPVEEPIAEASAVEPAAPEPEPEPLAAPAPPVPQPLPEENLQVFEDDNDYIDYALEALLQSLEPPYATSIPPGAFTVAGWEIDRQLDEVVRGIASPERPSRVAARDAALAAAAPPARVGSAGASGGASGGTDAGGGRIPQPPSGLKPPSRGRVSNTGGSLGSSRIPRPPSGVRVHLRPGSSGLDMNISMDGEGLAAQKSAAGAGAAGASAAARPPVRVHLRPNSGGLDMNFSMDGESLSLPAGGAAGGSGRQQVRVHLRPGSSGLDMDISMDGEGLAAQLGAAPERPGSSSGGRPGSSSGRPGSSSGRPMGLPFSISARMSGTGAAEGLPAIDEDQSAFFGGAAAAGNGDGDGGGADQSWDPSSSGGRPPVRVHLRPNNSRELNMLLSMDEDAMMMASPAAAAAAAAAARSAGASLLGDDDDDDAAAAGMAAAAEPPPPVAEASAEIPPLPSLEDAPMPLQGSLSGRANRASLRRSRQGGGSRPGSAAMMRDSVVMGESLITDSVVADSGMGAFRDSVVRESVASSRGGGDGAAGDEDL